MFKRYVRRGLALTLLAVLLTIVPTACGPSGVTYPESGATLEGKVTYGNEPVPFAMIIAVGQTSATTMVQRDGSYTLTNCPLGEVKIAVNTEAGRGEYMSAVMAVSQPGPDGKVVGQAKIKFVEVPKKYHDPETSSLRTTVNKGKNSFDIKIPK